MSSAGKIFSINPIDPSVPAGVTTGSGRLIRLMTDDELQLPRVTVLLDIAPAWRLLRVTLRKFRLPALTLAFLTLLLLALISLRLRLLATIAFLDSAPALASDELIDALTLDFLIYSIKREKAQDPTLSTQITHYRSRRHLFTTLNIH